MNFTTRPRQGHRSFLLRAFQCQKTVGQHDERHVMVPAAPTAALVVIRVPLELLIVLFDLPTCVSIAVSLSSSSQFITSTVKSGFRYRARSGSCRRISTLSRTNDTSFSGCPCSLVTTSGTPHGR